MEPVNEGLAFSSGRATQGPDSQPTPPILPLSSLGDPEPSGPYPCLVVLVSLGQISAPSNTVFSLKRHGRQWWWAVAGQVPWPRRKACGCRLEHSAPHEPRNSKRNTAGSSLGEAEGDFLSEWPLRSQWPDWWGPLWQPEWRGVCRHRKWGRSSRHLQIGRHSGPRVSGTEQRGQYVLPSGRSCKQLYILLLEGVN